MDLATGIGSYFLIWWVTLFTVLPLGVVRNPAPEEHQDPGAPVKHDLKRKLLINTALSFAVWLVIYILVELYGASFREWLRGY